MNIVTKTIALAVLALGIGGPAAPAMAGCGNCTDQVQFDTWFEEGWLSGGQEAAIREEFFAGQEVRITLDGYDDYGNMVDMDISIWRGGQQIAYEDDVGRDDFFFYPQQDGAYRIVVNNATDCPGDWSIAFKASWY